MEQAFTAILLKLIAEQGKEALLNNPKRFKSFLADYTHGEYKKESRLLLQALEFGSVKAIDSATDLDLCKQQQAKALRGEYFLAEEIAADLVDTLALALRGDASRMEPPNGAGNNDKTIPPKEIKEERARDLAAPLPLTPLGDASRTESPEGFARVTGGTFLLDDDDEKPVYTRVKSFLMGKRQVTQKEWGAVMRKNQSHFKGDNRPVESVSWNDIVEYCNKRSQKEGLTLAYRNDKRIFGRNIVRDFGANGYRLPTYEEWEFAVKGGNKALKEYA